MPRVPERMILLFAVLLAALAIAATGAAAEQNIAEGANDIAVTEDMVGKTLEDVKGTCDLIIGAFVYGIKARPDKFTPIHIFGDPPYSAVISQDMLGKGLRIVSAENCKLASQGSLASLKSASKLSKGWNFISASGVMLEKSFDDIKNDCSITKVRLYSPDTCDPRIEETEKCGGAYLKVPASEKLPKSYSGKGLWVYASSPCELQEYARPFLEAKQSFISISEDMLGQEMEALIGDCKIATATYYDASATQKEETARFTAILVDNKKTPEAKEFDARTIGKGLIVTLAEPATKCQLKIKGYTEKFGAAASLVKGNNLIGIPKSVARRGKSFADVKGACTIESIEIYDQKQGKQVTLSESLKLGPEHLGKAVWVKVSNENGCTLADTGIKGGEGVNLVPELEVKAPDNVKGGDKIEVRVSVKNVGNLGTADDTENCGASEGCHPIRIAAKLSFTKETAKGEKVAAPIEKSFDGSYSSTPQLKAGGPSLVIIRETVLIPADFSGKLIITAIADSNELYPELDETDNTDSVSLAVQQA